MWQKMVSDILSMIVEVTFFFVLRQVLLASRCPVGGEVNDENGDKLSWQAVLRRGHGQLRFLRHRDSC